MRSVSENPSKFKNLVELIQYFSNEEVYIKCLKKLRWKNGEYCPHCGCEKIYAFKDDKRFKCSDCRKQFRIKVVTIFEDSKISLQKWFVAIYLIYSHEKVISYVQLAKGSGITQKNAWFVVFHRLRHASKTHAFNKPLKNIVEADESTFRYNSRDYSEEERFDFYFLPVMMGG